MNAIRYFEEAYLRPSQKGWYRRERTDFSTRRKPEEIRTTVQPVVKSRRVCGVDVPSAIGHVADAVEKSSYILDLGDNWDDEGSPGYDLKTWERAARFVLRNAISLWENQGMRSEAPAVHNGPKGSIDIHWNTGSAELLVNVPAAMDFPATYYGLRKEDGTETKGNLNLSERNDWLFVWLSGK